MRLQNGKKNTGNLESASLGDSEKLLKSLEAKLLFVALYQHSPATPLPHPPYQLMRTEVPVWHNA
jgi:hypothetical protein